MGKDRLFGFRLVDASALLMFVFALGLLLIGFYYMYATYVYINAYGQIPVIEVIVMLLTLMVGFYIVYATLRYRSKTIR